MLEFYTRVEIPSPGYKIDYGSKLFFMGSCFSEHIGARMAELKFSICQNPYGVIYNPLSLSAGLDLLLSKNEFGKEDLSFYNELWFSFSHYSLFSDTDSESCLEKINKSHSYAKEFIKKADVLFITLGSSWYYRLKKTGQIVSNCHKIPATNFDRCFSTSEETYKALKKSITGLKAVNPKIKLVFTVSPVRHWKDGAIENQRSKAALVLAVAKLQNKLKEIYYFPSYEIFMDELRDYRFYAEDRIHPSPEAQEYIWKKIASVFLSKEAGILSKEVKKIITALNHRPRHTDTKAYKKFIQSIQDRMTKLAQKHVYLDFRTELRNLNKEIPEQGK